MMLQSEGGEAWEEATDFGVHANENKKVNSDRTHQEKAPTLTSDNIQAHYQ